MTIYRHLLALTPQELDAIATACEAVAALIDGDGFTAARYLVALEVDHHMDAGILGRFRDLANHSPTTKTRTALFLAAEDARVVRDALSLHPPRGKDFDRDARRARLWRQIDADLRAKAEEATA